MRLTLWDETGVYTPSNNEEATFTCKSNNWLLLIKTKIKNSIDYYNGTWTKCLACKILAIRSIMFNNKTHQLQEAIQKEAASKRLPSFP